MAARFRKQLMLAAILLGLSSTVAGQQKARLCEGEKWTLWWYKLAAGKPQPDREFRTAEKYDIKPESVTTDGGIELRGYRIRIREGSKPDQPRTSVFVVQGNAMLAEHLVDVLAIFLAQPQVDVYVFDYRGFGRSDGEARIDSFLEDISMLRKWIAEQERYTRATAYGLSAGAVMLLASTDVSRDFHRTVIDGSPSKAEDDRPFWTLKCPSQMDPVNRLGENAKNVLVLHGGKDRVVPLESAKELHAVAEKRANFVLLKEGVHPFMERDLDPLRARMTRIADFLLRDR